MLNHAPHYPVACRFKMSAGADRALVGTTTLQQVALRCRIVLAAESGEPETAIAVALQINRKTVRLWRDRFTRQGLQGLWEIAPGRGRKPTYSPNRVKAVIETTLQSKPKGSTHWSCRTLAANRGMSKSTVNPSQRYLKF